MKHTFTHSGTERRREPRVRLSVNVDFKSSHNFYSAKTRDISTGGLFIETNISIPIGSNLEVDLHFLKNRALVTAEVVWEMTNSDGETEGLGVQFVSLSETIRERIEAFMGLRGEMRVGLVEDNDPDETPDT